MFEDKKQLALLGLKHKKHQWALLCQAEEYLLQVNQIISNVEMASLQNDVIRALEAGKCALASIQSEIAVDYVEQLLDENSQLSSQVQQVNSLMDVHVDDDILEEYNQIQDQIQQKRIAVIPSVPENAPRRQIVQASRELSEDASVYA